jgi:MoxR-like ATPase
MNDYKFYEFYEGKGKSPKERNIDIENFEPLTLPDKAENYLADGELVDAVNIAIALGQPLLVTGEPGTGKTMLAKSIAYETGLNFLKFDTKTTSTATDLFYQYDALRRFQDAHIAKEKKDIKNIYEYIEFQALGAAIILAGSNEEDKRLLSKKHQNKKQRKSVVLIDEIDKAPRDLPNDILNEIEKMEFKVKETGNKFSCEENKYRPIVVLTSNSEKNLPEPFLRRCLFYHIEFPNMETLKKIIVHRYEKSKSQPPDFIDTALEKFYEIRGLQLKKRPATAEFLTWINLLKAQQIDSSEIKSGSKKLISSLSVLGKDKNDIAMIRKNFSIA